MNHAYVVTQSVVAVFPNGLIVERIMRNYQKMRALVASAQGRFCSVTFIKKDGTVRVMNIQPAAIQKHLKGDKASASAQQGAKTRAERHPNLLNVWDNGSQGIRSVNLDTVTEIKVDGEVYTYAKEA